MRRNLAILIAALLFSTTASGCIVHRHGRGRSYVKHDNGHHRGHHKHNKRHRGHRR